MKKTVPAKIFIFIQALMCVGIFNACGKIHVNVSGIQETEQGTTLPVSPEISDRISVSNVRDIAPGSAVLPSGFEDVSPDSGDLLSDSEILLSHSGDRPSDSKDSPLEAEDDPSKQAQWQVYICPDMPQPYIEVLEQYEQFMNADNQNFNGESIQTKLWGGEWKYLYDEICASWTSYLNTASVEEAENILRYSLTDLTGDGFPELIIAYGDTPNVIYNYSEEKGIGMEFASSYYTMTIYQNGVVEYASGGAYSSTTYLHFQEDSQEWVTADIIAASDTWDAARQEINDTKYYGGEWGEDGLLDKTITEQEYLRIQEKYVTEPMEFEWIPLAYNSAAVWHSYEKIDDFTYEHDFMTSRDGQGYHWWIYLEATYIIRDYGKKLGYDFTSDHWTVERIHPICSGYYNIVLSQNNSNASINLLCHPDEEKYAVLYAQYEYGGRTAGINETPCSSRLEWHDFDFHESCEMPSVENPYEDICETSVSSALYISLSRYEQEMGYDENWYVRELFGRSPFFDYLVESEEGFVWFCVDIGQHCFTYVTFE